NKEILNLTQKPQSGTYLIEASAGTGKTYSIANLYLHFILQGKKVSEILVVTFTEAATKELRERIRANLSKAFQVLTGLSRDEQLTAIISSYDSDDKKLLLEAAILNFDQAAIFTIHGFCQRMLQENAFESMSLFDAELLENEEDLHEEIVKDFIRQKTYLPDSQGSLNHKKLLSLVKNYNGQKIVDAVDQSGFEDLKNEFIDLLKVHLEEQLEVLKTSKQISHAKSSFYHPDKFEQYEKDLQDFTQGIQNPGLGISIKALSQNSIEAAEGKGKTAPEHELFKCAENLLPYFSEVTHKIEFLEFFAEKFKERKSELNVLTFDDLINKLHDVLSKEGENGLLHTRIREQFKVALVDEFQDTDPVQYEIFSTLFGNKSSCPEHSFYMIGDPKQSIYSFRGADIFAYLVAKNRADRMFTLDTNYRSEPELVSAVNHLFLDKGKEEAFAFAPENGKEGIEFDPVKSPESLNEKRVLHIETDSAAAKHMQLKWINTFDGEPVAKTALEQFVPEIVTAEIVDLLNLSSQGKAWFSSGRGREPVLPLDIAVLTYSHHQAFKIKEELNKHKVPCVIKKSGNVFESREAAALLRFLEAVHNPREKTIIPLLLSSFFSFNAAEIIDMDSSVHFEFLKEFAEYRNKWEMRGFLQTLQNFMVNHEVFVKALETSDGERIISNIYQLREIIHHEEESKGVGLTGLIRFLNEKINSENKEDEQYLQRLETDADAVQILTIHKSKGLEFPIVFCPYTWMRGYESSGKGDVSFHDEQGQYCISLNEDCADRSVYHMLATKENLGEQLRLLYVALTRAANRCYLYWGNINRENSILSYLAAREFSSEDFLAGAKPQQSPEQRKAYWQERLAVHSSINCSELIAEGVPALQLKEHSELSLIAPLNAGLSFSNWMNGSYSALIKHHSKVVFSNDLELAKDDDDEITYSDDQNDEEEAVGFFAFPKGATPGTAVHEIFEHIDFQDDTAWIQIIDEKLKKYRLHSDGVNEDEALLKERREACLGMIQNVLNTDLQGFCLKDIPLSQRLDEMDFYFPVKDINVIRLAELFRKHYTDERADFADDLLNLNYQMDHGFLNGAIDLTFEQDGRFYILDWKSNHFGNSYEDYYAKAVRDKIREKLYFLQYHIYTVALHLYLEKRLEGYSYKKNFGGVIYAFIRGMKPGTKFGVHYDRLPEGLVKDLSKL
ncbi:MAG: exodeoxyribonuclease V subunit beta, partial [Lentisphaeraceae bacterium]|nr:exodeoxyribonuclease V subunit beta [Lentisphaeraceae bacterium]